MTGVTVFVSILMWASPVRGQSACRPADSYSANVVEYARQFLGAQNSGTVAVRNSVGLQGVQPSEASLLTAGPVCARLLTVFNALAGTPNQPRLLYVVRLGTKHYLVRDTSGKAGEFTPSYVFDSRYRMLKAMLGA